REFTMKDAYSFHTSQEDLEKTYARFYEAYERIYKRAGAKNVVAVKSDSGMMGGSVSHEFMLLTDIGEDTLAICPECGYSANMEVASCDIENEAGEVEELKKVSTPGTKTIEALKDFLTIDEKRLAKAVVYQKNADDSYIIVFIRGDLEVNETKLRNYLGAEVHPAAVITEESGIVAGFIGPIGLKEGIKVVFDKSLEGINSLVCGANETDYHFTGMNVARDVGEVEYIDVAKIFEGAVCPVCGKPSITVKRGIEIGNIFQLGQKYTKSMNMTYLDRDGEAKYPIMGCYGIGVGRLMASVCEESCDKFGPIWPMSIAPWQVEICNLRSTDEGVTKVAEDLYDALTKSGVEVLYDDRDIRPGSMFADADLFGIPVRVVVSPKNCDAGVVEVSTRDKSIKTEFAIDSAESEIKALVKKLLDEYNI
ncbi:MAG: proline--tRNA ligase, partial [Clostridia bacterium]|nr:proline--tRNA ligase [Clostridia bacterium]